MLEIQKKWKVQGTWLVRVITHAPCGCSSSSQTLTFNQEKEPTEKEIEDEVNNKR
jgi:hypothetical protein